METVVDVVRKTDCETDDDFFTSVVQETVSRCGMPSLSSRSRISVGIALVPDDEIAELNRVYRGKVAPTDILSFSEHDDGIPSDADIFLGDLVIAPSFVRRAAFDDGVAFSKELAFVVSHGTLHLLGFDHSQEMYRIQDEVTERLSSE